MHDIPIPAHAVGRPGMVAMLKRLGIEAEDRLVAVREPAGLLSAMVGRDKPVFCWRVHLLGQPLTIKGRPARDLYVPDVCLVPMGGELSSDELAALAREHGEADFTESLLALRETLGATAMPLEAFEQFAHHAAQQIAIERALEVVPTSTALREIGFVAERAGGDTLIWAGVHAGIELRFRAAANMVMTWTLVATTNTPRQAIWDERYLPREAPRSHIVAQVPARWKAAFRDAPVPDVLRMGDAYEGHRRLLRRINLSLPTLCPNPAAFRAIRKWLIGPESAASLWLEDKWVLLRQEDGMLRIEIDGVPYGCPAGGLWAEAREVRLQDLAVVPVEVLRQRSLRLTQTEECILVNEWRLPSRKVMA